MPTRRDILISGATALAGFAAARIVSADDRPGPGPRAGHAMAWHGGARAICLIGGDRHEIETGAPLEQVWLWDGRGWRLHQATGAPPATSLVAAAADAERGSVLAFGGFSILGPQKYGPPAGDLWELDRTLVWRRHHPQGAGPGGRHHHAAAFDSARRRFVLYGGFDAANAWQTDVWEWDGRAWQRFEPATGPGPRAHHAMAYDAGRGVIVLRGGTTPEKKQPSDTWTWDGRAWRVAAAGGPGPGGAYRMAYDASRQVVVLAGGDTCLWDGTTWTKASPTRSPTSRMVHGLAFDPVRRVTVLYGGSVDRANVADTWEWDGADWQMK
jgi:hypothetical protein